MKHQKWIENILYLFDLTNVDSLQQLLIKSNKYYIIADSDQILKENISPKGLCIRRRIQNERTY